MVMWLLLLLALLGAGLLHGVRISRVAAASVVGEVQARAAADGGIRRVILSLLDGRDPLRWQLDGSPRIIDLFGFPMSLSMVSETGKIDLNAAPPELLTAMFQSVGVAPTEASSLAISIVAWRTRNAFLGDGNPDAPYRDAARPYGPRQGPFRSVGELRLVIGMTDDLYAAVRPLVTIWSHAPGVDRGVASPGVLEVLASMGDKLALTQQMARERGQAAGADRLPGVGEALLITAQLDWAGRAMQRQAIVQLAGSRKDPYRVLLWQ